jgi:hypothetical protein
MKIVAFLCSLVGRYAWDGSEWDMDSGCGGDIDYDRVKFEGRKVTWNHYNELTQGIGGTAGRSRKLLKGFSSKKLKRP